MNKLIVSAVVAASLIFVNNAEASKREWRNVGRVVGGFIVGYAIGASQNTPQEPPLPPPPCYYPPPCTTEVVYYVNPPPPPPPPQVTRVTYITPCDRVSYDYVAPRTPYYREHREHREYRERTSVSRERTTVRRERTSQSRERTEGRRR